MDPAAAERLKKLQMEDLGTARREHISTSDSKRFQKVCLEDLEATRRSNKAGSEAQQAAEVNRSRLSGWANVYKELSDTQGLENLDNILDGQSHRAQLSALIHNHGGQSYTKTVNKKDNFLRVAEIDRGRGHGPSRRSLHTGRGGGIMGTRGRQLAPFPSSASARTSNQGAIAKLGRYTVEAPPGRTRLDPALDSNNDPSGKMDARPKPKTSAKMSERTTLRTRRPIVGDYARILSPPESFLAIARRMVNGRDSGDDTSSQGPDNKPEELPKESQKATKEHHSVSEKATYTSPRSSTEKPVASRPPKAISTPGATKKLPAKAADTPARASSERPAESRLYSGGSPAPRATNKDRASSGKPVNTVPHQSTVKHIATPPRGPRALTQKYSTPTPAVPGKAVSSVSTSAANASAKSGEDRVPQELSTSGATNGQVTTADSHATERSTESLSSSKESTIPKTESEPVSTSTKGTEDLLLDLSSTPPEQSPLEDRDFMNSPACQDLRGIDFRPSLSQEAETTPDSSGSEQPPSKPGDVTLSTNVSNGAMTLAEYQRQLALLNAVLEGTTSAVLGDEYCQNLKDCKQELEAKIKEVRQGPHESSNQLQKTPELSNTTSKTAMKEAETPAKDTPSEQDKKTDTPSPEGSASSLRLKQAVLAPVFYPRSSSFCGYRSPKNSISSNSTSPPSTPVPARSAAIPIRAPPVSEAPVSLEPPTSHIFGDHLLPGRCSRVASQKYISSTSGTSTDEPSASNVSFSIPKKRPALLNAQTPAFESPDNTGSSTQAMASNDTALPLKTESISHVGSPTGSSASWEPSRSQSTSQITNDVQKIGSSLSSLGQSIHDAAPSSQTGSSRNPPLPQKTETVTSASSTAHLGVNKAPSKNATPTMLQKEAQGMEPKPSSLRQSIHAAPMEAPSKHQPTTGVQKVDSNLDSSKRSTFASSSKPQQRSSSGGLGGIMSSIYAMPENHKPTR